MRHGPVWADKGAPAMRPAGGWPLSRRGVLPLGWARMAHSMVLACFEICRFSKIC